MKKREIILDFTSLLDVTLIVIFFFVIFSHLDGEENKTRTDEKIQEYNVAIEAAEKREQEVEKLKEELEENLEIVSEYSSRSRSNANELIEFKEGKNLKLFLDMKDDGWELRIVHDESIVSIIKNKDSISDDIIEALQKSDYSINDTIFCDFIFDGSIGGTASAYREIEEEMEIVTKKYKHMYISETDLSMGVE